MHFVLHYRPFTDIRMFDTAPRILRGGHLTELTAIEHTPEREDDGTDGLERSHLFGC